MKKRTLIIIGLIILVLIIAGLIYQNYKSGKNSGYDMVKVRRGDVVEIVSVTGSVKPSSEISLQFTSSGKVADKKVKVGDSVKAGDILISLDSSDLAFQAQNAQAAVDVAQARLNQLLAGASAEDVALAQTAVLNAQKTLDDAKKSLADAQITSDNALTNAYEDAQRTIGSSLFSNQSSLRSNAETLEANDLQGIMSLSDPQALADAKSLRIGAENEYNAAKAAADLASLSSDHSKIDSAAQSLKKSLSVAYSALGRTYDALTATIASANLTQAELDTFRTTISTGRSNLNTALTSVTSAQQTIALQKITNQTNLNTSQAKVTSAEGALETANNQLALKLARPRQADIDLYEAQVKQARATLNQIRNQIAQKSLIAPIDGIITNVVPNIGETVSANQAVVLMNSVSNFEIESDIAETDIAKIKIGNPVTITLDAFGEAQKWEGKIVKIDPAQTIIQGVVYYKTTIGFSEDDERIKPGMTANLEIETARRNQVLLILAKAFTEAAGKRTVRVLGGDNQIKEVIITTGLKDTEGRIEIISGLSEGETVLIEKTKK